MILLALFVYAAAEIATFVVVAEHIGVLLAVILVLGISSAGPVLVRRAGIGVIEHARQRMRRGEPPTRELLDGVLLLFGGLLVCIPGFLGDVVGLLLLLGPVRSGVFRLVGHRLAGRLAVSSFGAPPSGGAPSFGRGRRGRVVEAAAHEGPHPDGVHPDGPHHDGTDGPAAAGPLPPGP